MKWIALALLLTGCATVNNEKVIVPKTSGPDAPGVIRALPYGEGPMRVMDLYNPPNAKNAPLVIFVHGGAWQGGSRDEYAAICAALQKQGIVAATIDYRLSPSVTHPSHAEDAASAIAWLKDQTSKFNIDPAKIFVVGHSAGGHILATIATDPKLSAKASVAGFVGLEGIYDIPNLAKRWPTYPNWFLNRAFGPDPTKWPAASPTRLKVVSKTPWLLVHSKGDELVDLPQTDDFATHLKSAGVKVKVLHPEGKTHDGVVGALSNPGDEVTKAILGFLNAKRL